MTDIRQILIYLAAFLILAVAANRISRLFLRARLSLLTGLLVIAGFTGGLLAGDPINLSHPIWKWQK
jgi:hypothetical protein